jgi:hypothetical protein
MASLYALTDTSITVPSWCESERVVPMSPEEAYRRNKELQKAGVLKEWQPYYHICDI